MDAKATYEKVYANGDRYEGDWKDGKRTGRGVIVWGSGNRYEGDFKDGRRTGRGTFYFANGSKCEGDWKDDRLLGTGKGWTEGRETKCYSDGGTIQFTE